MNSDHLPNIIMLRVNSSVEEKTQFIKWDDLHVALVDQTSENLTTRVQNAVKLAKKDLPGERRLRHA